MQINFDIYAAENLGTLFKDNEIIINGLEASTSLDLSLVNELAVNFKCGRNAYTDYVEIIDRDTNKINIPFKTDVLKAGVNAFEIIATMKDGSVKTSQTNYYQINKSLENPNAGEAETNYPILIELINKVSMIAHSGDTGHTHTNKLVLDKITNEKLNEWDNKANKEHEHSYNDLTNKPTIPTVDVNKSYVDAQISSHTHNYATPNHTHDVYVTKEQYNASLGDIESLLASI